MDRFIGKVVQLIYIDRYRQVSFRDVKIISVKGDKLMAYCFTAKAHRVFIVNNIVDVELIKRVI